MASRQSLSWLHLSDLHFGQPAGAYEDEYHKLIINALLRDAKELRGESTLIPDYIFITGDIAYSGSNEEYGEANNWLTRFRDEWNNKSDDIFFVPGNHDIDKRIIDGDPVKKTIHSKVRGKPMELDEYLKSPNFFEPFWGKFRNYASFSEQYNSSKIECDRPFWNYNSTSRNLSFIGLNTAILCDGSEDDSSNNTALGLSQIRKAFEGIDKKELLILSLHHPPTNLFDGGDLLSHIDECPHIVLSGHKHQPHMEIDGCGIKFHAGAIYDDYKGAPNPRKLTKYSYYLCSLQEDGLHVWPRKFRPDKNKFVPDYDFVLDHGIYMSKESWANGNQGVVDFKKLPDKIKEWLKGDTDNQDKPKPSNPIPEGMFNIDSNDLSVGYIFENKTLNRSILFDIAQEHYKFGKRKANQSKWSESVKEHLKAYALFDSLDSKSWTARVAGRLAWGLIVQGYDENAKSYLKKASEIDKAQAIGDYFWAIQYCLRVNNEKLAYQLTKEFIKICFELGLLSFESIESESKIETSFAGKFVKDYIQFIIEYNAGQGWQRASASDKGKQFLIEAEYDKTNAVNSLAQAAKIFRNHDLSSYSAFCDFQRYLLTYSDVESFACKKKALVMAKNAFGRIELSVPYQREILNGTFYAIKANIKLLTMCEKLEEKSFDKKETFLDILAAMKKASSGFENTGDNYRDQAFEIAEDIEGISSANGNLTLDLRQQNIDVLLNKYSKLYNSIPYLLGDYMPILVKVLKEEYEGQE